MTPVQASKKTNEQIVFDNLSHRRVRQKPKIKLGQLVRTVDIKRVFSKGDSTNWSYKLYTITEIIRDAIPSYIINYSRKRYNEKLLISTNLTLEENNQIMKKLNLIQ